MDRRDGPWRQVCTVCCCWPVRGRFASHSTGMRRWLSASCTGKRRRGAGGRWPDCGGGQCRRWSPAGRGTGSTEGLRTGRGQAAVMAEWTGTGRGQAL